MADRLLLTKTDLAEPAAVTRLRGQLRELNPVAEILPAGLDERARYRPSIRTRGCAAKKSAMTLDASR